MCTYSFTASTRFSPGILCLLLLAGSLLLPGCTSSQPSVTSNNRNQYREHVSINEGWKFMRYTSEPDKLIYDERPVATNRNDNIVADTRAADSTLAASSDR